MAKNNLLMLFVRNPELGKVKTRLAKDLGEQKALAIYIKLLEHTRIITQDLEADKLVYYAGEMKESDLWDNSIYHKKVQPDGDLGYKMEHAFSNAFKDGYNAVVIIGSDCLQLSRQIIEQAFEALKNHDVVIGPATDGGYYLLGMKQLHSDLFWKKPWSTSGVFPLTVETVNKMDLTYRLLPVLSDIDRAEDVDAALLAR